MWLKRILMPGLVLAALAALTLTGAAYSTVTEKTVSSADELVAALGPDRVIRLEPGIYDLSDCYGSSKYTEWQDCFDGEELVIRGVDNMSIIGPENGLARIQTGSAYANVLIVKDSANVRFANLEAGHYPGQGSCTGAVFCFVDCQDMEVDHCVLFGCGIYGLILTRTNGLQFYESTIRDCSYGVLSAHLSRALSFYQSSFMNNSGYNMIQFGNCREIEFTDCRISGNRTEADYSSYTLFELLHSQVRLVSTTITQNEADYLYRADSAGDLILEGSRLLGNSWHEAEYGPDPEEPWLSTDF